MIEEKKIIEDKVDNIILAGCSFSDTGLRLPKEPILPKNIIFNNEFMSIGGLPGEAKQQHFIEIELNKQNKQHNIELYNVARGSFGNHVITHTFKEKVNDILHKKPNSKIVGIVQLSSLLRADSVQVDINTKDFPFDYENPFLEQKIYSLETFYEKHLDNIIDLKEFCNSKNIEVLVYFGWANFFSNYFIEYPKLVDKVNKVKEIVTFIEYTDTEDECANYCAGPKPMYDKHIKNIDGNKIEIYKTKGDKFGGLAEYSRLKLDIGYRYISWFDSHPSTAAHFVWYKDIVRPFLVKTGVFDTNSIFPTNIEDNLKFICEVQRTRFLKWFGLNYRHEDCHSAFRRYNDTYYKSMSYEIQYLLEEKVKEFSK